MIATENNKLIAEFMGNRNYLYNNDKSSMYFILTNTAGEELIVNYDNDWGLLMEVVEKIESLGYKINNFSINNYIYIGKDDVASVIINEPNLTKKEAFYQAVVKFVNWYNENGAKNN